MWKVYGRDKARDTLARKCVCHQGHEQDHDGGVGAAVGMRRPSQRNRTNRHLISQIPCLRLFIRRMSPLKFSRLRRRSTLGIHDHRCYTTPFHFPMTVVKYSPQTMNRLLKAILRNLFSRNVQIPIRENPFSLSFFFFFFIRKDSPLLRLPLWYERRIFPIEIMRLHITYPAISYHLIDYKSKFKREENSFTPGNN